MLTSERLVRKHENGTIKEKFMLPKGTRNEALDCYNYAYCLAYTIGKVQNLYSSNYDKVWDLVIGKKIKKSDDNNNETQKQQPTKKPMRSWMGNNSSGWIK
jgi:phage terminase large subunit GpA-like protein